ncbi:NAD-dependent epimerase/dehydratase family protein [Flexivirga caeni]|uniref:NAD-dependent epimerase/dehydratase family protein n=1 Tax=Flexivirga caeni TaxID=2294115 RepID=A0A3M9MI58_9MICO|nr:NAD-dependent epimerase/dehydratase family protein [Flexivirga caeni]RNI24885.1 NAD-dependent epimerase/dehydratase family protein [Flexivirga caeni]
MRFLVLGGTAWLGGEIVRAALARDHEVVCMARGTRPVPEGAELVAGDRDDPQAYSALTGDFDAAIDVTSRPAHARGAVDALRDQVARWAFVSTCSVYAQDDRPGQDESAPLLPAWTGEFEIEKYGECKVACEEAVLAAYGDRALIARPGLITGPGDASDRTGYWPLRFAHPATEDGAVLVPDAPDASVQLIDARDLAQWLVESVERGVGGVFTTASEHRSLTDYLALARSVAGHAGPVVAVDQDWIERHQIAPWAGDRSFPLWLPQPEYAGFATRIPAAARAAGLRTRPLEDSIRDTLAWELRTGPGRTRRAGLSPADERELIAAARRDA